MNTMLKTKLRDVVNINGKQKRCQDKTLFNAETKVQEIWANAHKTRESL